jgi:hypothetical protein
MNIEKVMITVEYRYMYRPISLGWPMYKLCIFLPIMNKTESSLSSGTLPFFTLRGLTDMMFPSGLLKPIAVAGNPSVTRFTQSSWTYKVME